MLEGTYTVRRESKCVMGIARWWRKKRSPLIKQRMTARNSSHSPLDALTAGREEMEKSPLTQAKGPSVICFLLRWLVCGHRSAFVCPLKFTYFRLLSNHALFLFLFLSILRVPIVRDYNLFRLPFDEAQSSCPSGVLRLVKLF